MSIENINSKIIAEALDYSKGVLSQAQGQSDAILKEARDRAEKIKEAGHKKVGEEADLLLSRRMSVASLEARKIKLQAMQNQINESFRLALEGLAAMKEEDYLNMLTAAILEIGGQGGELILNEKDRARLGDKLLAKVNDTKKVGQLSLAQDLIQAKGGFVLRRGSTEINATLETMVNEIKEATIPQVVKLLYGSQGE